jgi:hypothetical protein
MTVAMNNTFKRIICSAALLTAVFNCVPAHAQYPYSYGYSPFSGTAHWLNMARTLTYPLNRYSGNTMPFYMANSLIYSASYLANQRAMNRQRDMYYGDYTDPEPLNEPRKRKRAWFNSPNVNDQIVHAQWLGQQQQQLDDEDIPVPQNQPIQPHWNNDPVPPGEPAATVPPQAVPAHSPPPVTESATMPPVAPQAAAPPKRISEPLGNGFISVVLERYGGDISATLRDKDTAKYAQSVGLIDSGKYAADKIPREKVQLMRAIFADSSEPASVRINAVRVLLKH